MAQPKLGSGGRFAALKAKLASRPGVENPGALAAYIGRKKYGAKKMASLSLKGRMAAKSYDQGGYVPERTLAALKGGEYVIHAGAVPRHRKLLETINRKAK